MVPGRPPDLRAAGDALTGPDRRVFVIFNPASGRGRGARRIATYRALLERHLPHAVIGTTSAPGHEAELATRAVDEGYDVVVAAGGDGTWSNVADRLVGAGRRVSFGLLPNGTGNDFGRNLAFDPAGAEAAVLALASGSTRRVDVGRLETPSASEHRPDHFEPRHFLNLIGFGFDIAVLDAAKNARFLKGELLYKLTALGQLFRFPGIQAGVATDGGVVRAAHHLMLTVTNGRYFGGGFPITPDGAVDDGLLHACRIEDARPLTRLGLFNKAERGLHVEAPQVEVLSDRAFRLTFDAPPRFEMDGEVRISSEAELHVRVLPAALDVIAP